MAGTVAAGPSGPYNASKHAQLALSRSLTVELGGRGIRVHTINPGFVHTPGFPNRDRFGRRLRPLVAEPDQVAEAIEKTATDLGAPGRDDQYGWGLVNAAAAVNYDPSTPVMNGKKSLLPVRPSSTATYVRLSFAPGASSETMLTPGKSPLA